MGSILKSLWLQYLPANVQAILSISEATDHTRLLKMVDRILEVREPFRFSTVDSSASSSTAPDNLRTRFEAARSISFGLVTGASNAVIGALLE